MLLHIALNYVIFCDHPTLPIDVHGMKSLSDRWIHWVFQIDVPTLPIDVFMKLNSHRQIIKDSIRNMCRGTEII